MPKCRAQSASVQDDRLGTYAASSLHHANSVHVSAAGDGANTIDVLFILLDVEFLLENAPVLQAQVGDQILALRGQGLRVGVLSTSRDPIRFARVIGKTLDDAGVWVTLIEHRGLPINVVRIARAIHSIRRHVRLRGAYARAIWGPLALRLSGSRLPYVYDVRGALADETRAARSAAWKASIFNALERWCVKHAQWVTAVSGPLAQDLAVRYGRSDVIVIPSCLRLENAQRLHAIGKEIRAKLGVSAQGVLCVYSGGVDHYQQIPKMLELWRSLLSEQDVRFLMLTNEAFSVRRGDPLEGIGALGDRVIRRSVSRADVPAYLQAADIGFMLRENRFMNRVASPVKFPEYLAAGLGVVASPGIGDISDLIVDHDIGVLVDVSDVPGGAEAVRDFIGRVRFEREDIRQRAGKLAETRYDWNAYAPVYHRMYMGDDA